MEDSELLDAIARFTQRMAEWPAQVQGARWSYLFGNRFQADDADCADAGYFDNACDQSHRLIA